MTYDKAKELVKPWLYKESTLEDIKNSCMLQIRLNTSIINEGCHLPQNINYHLQEVITNTQGYIVCLIEQIKRRHC